MPSNRAAHPYTLSAKGHFASAATRSGRSCLGAFRTSALLLARSPPDAAGRKEKGPERRKRGTPAPEAPGWGDAVSLYGIELRLEIGKRMVRNYVQSLGRGFGGPP